MVINSSEGEREAIYIKHKSVSAWDVLHFFSHQQVSLVVLSTNASLCSQCYCTLAHTDLRSRFAGCVVISTHVLRTPIFILLCNAHSDIQWNERLNIDQIWTWIPISYQILSRAAFSDIISTKLSLTWLLIYGIVHSSYKNSCPINSTVLASVFLLLWKELGWKN